MQQLQFDYSRGNQNRKEDVRKSFKIEMSKFANWFMYVSFIIIFHTELEVDKCLFYFVRHLNIFVGLAHCSL